MPSTPTGRRSRSTRAWSGASPATPSTETTSAGAGADLSLALAATGDLNAALRLAERAAALYEELVQADRGDPEIRWRLGRCLDEVGRIRIESGRPVDAAEPLERAVEFYEVFARDNPAFYGVDVARNRVERRASTDNDRSAEEATGVDSGGQGR